MKEQIALQLDRPIRMDFLGGNLGFGFEPNWGFFQGKNFSLGVNYNYSESYTFDRFSLTDFNGDGRPDLVVNKGSRTVYRPLEFHQGHGDLVPTMP